MKDKMQDDKIKQLADTLKKQGLAASMYEAIEKAKSILNVRIGTQSKENNNHRFSGEDYDIKEESATLNELMGEVGIKPEEIELQKQEKLTNLKMEVEELKSKLKENKSADTWELKKKIAEVNEELDKIEAANQNK